MFFEDGCYEFYLAHVFRSKNLLQTRPFVEINQESAHFPGIHELVVNKSWSSSEYTLDWHKADHPVTDEIPEGRSSHP